jgi:hypothetical protein
MQPNAFVVATFLAAMYLTIWAGSSARTALLWAVVALVVTASDSGTYGRQIWREAVGTKVPSDSFDLREYYSRFLTAPRPADIPGMSVPYLPTAGLLENWYYGRYSAFYKAYSTQPNFAEFMGLHGRKIFFSPTLEAAPEGFAQWFSTASAFETGAGATALRDGTYDGNVLRLRYRTTRDCYLIFVDNWDPDWRAVVDGANAPIAHAFGTFKAVRIRAGTGTVAFEYHARLPYWAVAFVGIFLALIVGAVGWKNRRRDLYDPGWA